MPYLKSLLIIKVYTKSFFTIYHDIYKKCNSTTEKRQSIFVSSHRRALGTAFSQSSSKSSPVGAKNYADSNGIPYIVLPTSFY